MAFSAKNLSIDNFHEIHKVKKVHWFIPPLEDIKMIESESESFVEGKNSDIWEIEKLISQNKFVETANKLRQLESHLTASSTKITKLKGEIESEKNEKSELLSKQKKQEKDVKKLKRQLLAAQELKSNLSTNFDENLDIARLEKKRYDNLWTLFQENTGNYVIDTSNLSNEESKTSNMMESLKQNEKKCVEFNNFLKEVQNNLDLSEQSLIGKRKHREYRETKLMQLKEKQLALQDKIITEKRNNEQFLEEMEKEFFMKLNEMLNKHKIVEEHVGLVSFSQDYTQRDLDVEYAKIQQLENNLDKMKSFVNKINIDNSALEEEKKKKKILNKEILTDGRKIYLLEARLHNLKYHIGQNLEQIAHEEEMIKLNEQLSSVLEQVAEGEKAIKCYLERSDDLRKLILRGSKLKGNQR